MGGFSNAELQNIRDNLRCGHCKAVFKGSDSQARKVKYEKKTVFRSDACRYAVFRNKFCKPIPNRGPCGTCGKTFFSRAPKKFRTLDCYLKSDQFVNMVAKNHTTAEGSVKGARARKNGIIVFCMECNAEIYQTHSTPRKFCSRPCYRSYMVKRFDRWIANPEGLALPQCYDEFLDCQELTRLIGECSWRGQWLTLHVNFAHGIPAQEFKRAAGFNLNSGIVGKNLSQRLSERTGIGIALNPALRAVPVSSKVISYRSKEASEHHRKARALAQGSGPQRKCNSCGKLFVQSTRFGRALYCSVACRTKVYSGRKKASTKRRIHSSDGTFRWEDIE